MRLAQLEQAELVFRRGEPPEAVYSFKHALVRDAAYESLLKSRRQQLHGQIARALEERFPDIVASQPEIVAHHFTEAGLVDLAIDYWLKAGNLALSRSANAEAVKHLRQGIELTRSKAPSARTRPQRTRFLPGPRTGGGGNRRRCRARNLEGFLTRPRPAGRWWHSDGTDDRPLGYLLGSQHTGGTYRRARGRTAMPGASRRS